MIMSAIVCGVTVLVQAEAIQPIEMFSLSERLANVLTAYATYLEQLFYPVGLAAYYPLSDLTISWSSGQIILSLALLVIISLAVFRERKKHPYLLVGWLWYLGMLVPVIGLMQVGTQSHADRYTYLPHIGLLILLTWGCVEWSAAWRYRRTLFGFSGAVVVAALILCARKQTTYWRDTISLWNHDLACTSQNAFVEDSLGMTFLDSGQVDEARRHLQRAVEIQPFSAPHLNNLGMAVFRSGQVDEGVTLFRMSLGIDPEYAPAHNNLGIIFLKSGRMREAIAHFQVAIRSDPKLADAQNNLANALMLDQRPAEAVAHYEKVIELAPDDYPNAYHNLAWVLATSREASLRDGQRAVALAIRANQLSGGRDMQIVRTLAAAYAEAGQYPKAVEVAGQAVEIAIAQNNQAWADALQSEKELYQAGRPLRYPILPN
jgi:tetratricopeptide (TPR) repeat protein